MSKLDKYRAAESAAKWDLIGDLNHNYTRASGHVGSDTASKLEAYIEAIVERKLYERWRQSIGGGDLVVEDDK